MFFIFCGPVKLSGQILRQSAQEVDWEAVLEHASRGGQSIVLSFCAEQLEVCESMADACANSEPFQAAISDELIWLEIDANSLGPNLEFKGFKVLNLPELLLFSSEGAPLARRAGSWEPNQVLEWARKDWVPYVVRIKSTEGQGWSALAQLALDAGAFGLDVQPLREKWLAGRPMQMPLEKHEWRMLFESEIGLDEPWFAFLIAHFDEMEQEWGYAFSDGFIVGRISQAANASLEAGDSLGLQAAFRAISAYYPEEMAQQLILRFQLREAELGGNWDRYPGLCSEYLEACQQDISAIEANDLAWNLYGHCAPEEGGKLGLQLARLSVRRDPQYWNLHTLASFELQQGMEDEALRHAQEAKQACGNAPDCKAEVEELLGRIPKRK